MKSDIEKLEETIMALNECVGRVLRFSKAAKEFIDSHAADPDITGEMVIKYREYQKRLKELNVSDEEWDLIK